MAVYECACPVEPWKPTIGGSPPDQSTMWMVMFQRNELVEGKRVAHGRNALIAAGRIRSRLRLHLVTDDPLVTVVRIPRFVLAAFHSSAWISSR
jgi:hypothetical protein